MSEIKRYKTTIARTDGKVDSNGISLSGVGLLYACKKAIGSVLCEGIKLVDVIEEGVFINAIFESTLEEDLTKDINFVTFGFKCKLGEDKVATLEEDSVMSISGLDDNHSDEGATPLTLI